jgi:DNA-directed RNA polymerase specialized sigma24 family protein
MTDRDLLEAIERDPEDGIRQVLERYEGVLLGRLRRHARDRRYGDTNVEDVFQEAILRLVDPQNREELRRAGGEILPWLSRWGYWRLDDAARNRGLPLSELLATPTPRNPSPASPSTLAVQAVFPPPQPTRPLPSAPSVRGIAHER